MFEYDTSKDMFWKVGDRPFFNKMAALSKSLQTKQPVTFHLFEDVFDTCDWLTEPKESWGDLLKERAQQLRDSHKYLRLWYSGGVDSQTVLMTFIKNNIFLDEIIMMRHDLTGKGFYSGVDIEINDVAVPFLNSMKQSLEKTKITLMDLDEKCYETYFNTSFEELGGYRLRISPIREAAWLVPEYFKEKNICEIRGYEKPSVTIKNNKFYTSIMDTTNAKASVGDHNLQCFFTSNEMPSLHIKQVHMLKKHLKNHYKIKTNEQLVTLETKNYNFRDHVNEICRYPLWKSISLGKGTRNDILVEGNSLVTWPITSRLYVILNNLERYKPSLLDQYQGKLRNQKNSDWNFSGIESTSYCIGE